MLHSTLMSVAIAMIENSPDQNNVKTLQIYKNPVRFNSDSLVGLSRFRIYSSSDTVSAALSAIHGFPMDAETSDTTTKVRLMPTPVYSRTNLSF